MKKLKLFCAWLLVVALSLSLTGCFTDENAVPPGMTGLQVWTNYPMAPNYKSTLLTDPTNKSAKMTKELVEEFELQNPTVKLQLVNKGWGNELNKNLISGFATNTEGDVVVGETYIQTFINNGYFEPFDGAGPLFDNIIEQARTPAMKDGKLYAIPAWTGTFSLYVNRKVLRDADIIDSSNVPYPQYAQYKPLYPETWEDILVICKAVKSALGKDKGGMVLSNVPENCEWRSLAYLRGAGGDYAKDGQPSFDSAENIRAYKMLRELQKTAPHGTMGVSNDRQLFDYLYANKAAYIVEGTDFMVSGEEFMSDDLYAVELPVFNGCEKSNVVVGTAYFSISSRSTKKDIAKKFCEFLMTDFAQQRFLEANYRIPTSKSYLESEEIKTLPSYGEVQTFLKPLQDADNKFSGGLYGFQKNASLIWEAFESFHNKILTDASYTDEVLNSAARDLQKYASEKLR